MGESDESEEICLQKLKNYIKESNNPLLKGHDDEFLLRFVRGRKLRSKYAFDTLETFFHMRFEKYANLYNNLRPSGIAHVLNSGMMGILKHRDEKGRKIVYFRIRNWELDKCTADEIMIACIVYAEEMAHSQKTQENGIIMICDYQGFTWAHARHYSLSQMRMFINIFLFSYPTRFGQGHMLNVPHMWLMAYNVFKPFLPRKVNQRIFVSREGHKSLHENISVKILPEWLGGELSEEDAEDPHLKQSILEKEDFYANFNKLG